MAEIVWVHSKDVPAREAFPGIRVRTLWRGENGAKAQVVEIDPGSCWQGIDVHEPGPEEVYVVSGVFNDGEDFFQKDPLYTIRQVLPMYLSPRKAVSYFFFIPKVNWRS